MEMTMALSRPRRAASWRKTKDVGVFHGGEHAEVEFLQIFLGAEIFGFGFLLADNIQMLVPFVGFAEYQGALVGRVLSEMGEDGTDHVPRPGSDGGPGPLLEYIYQIHFAHASLLGGFRKKMEALASFVTCRNYTLALGGVKSGSPGSGRPRPIRVLT